MVSLNMFAVYYVTLLLSQKGRIGALNSVSSGEPVFMWGLSLSML